MGPGDVASASIINGLRVKQCAYGILSPLAFFAERQRRIGWRGWVAPAVLYWRHSNHLSILRMENSGARSHVG